MKMIDMIECMSEGGWETAQSEQLILLWVLPPQQTHLPQQMAFSPIKPKFITIKF